MKQYNKGFTLIEVLISVLILAIISVAGYSTLRILIGQQQIIVKNFDKIDDLQRAIFVMERDFLQMAPRSVRTRQNDLSPAMQSEYGEIEFTRAGRPLVVGRSTFLRVGYLVKDKKLIRFSWPVINRTDFSKPVKKVLLSNVKKLSFRFLHKGPDWLKSWPPKSLQTSAGSKVDDNKTILPRALIIDIDINNIGKITRIIPGALEIAK